MKTSYYNLEHQSEPSFFIRGPSPLARFIFFSTLSLALIAIDTHLSYLSAFRQKMEEYLHPLELMVNAPGQLYQYVDEYFLTNRQLMQENKAFKSQLLKSNVDVQSLKLLAFENAYLRRLLNLNKQLNEQGVLGEILHASSDQFAKKVVVNRGALDQVKLGAAVVDDKGVIGQITRLYSHTSVVTLITDKLLEIPVLVERNGLRAIAFGYGQDNLLEIPYLPANIDIRPGDKLSTSGIDGIYPSGLAVGIVQKISVAPGSAFARILCAPAGRVEHSRQVLIVNSPISQAAVAPVNLAKDNAKEPSTINSRP